MVVIVGQVTTPVANRNADTNPTTEVVARYSNSDFCRQGLEYVLRCTMCDVTSTATCECAAPAPTRWSRGPTSWGRRWLIPLFASLVGQ